MRVKESTDDMDLFKSLMTSKEPCSCFVQWLPKPASIQMCYVLILLLFTERECNNDSDCQTETCTNAYRPVCTGSVCKCPDRKYVWDRYVHYHWNTNAVLYLI